MGGWRIIRTMGKRLTDLAPPQGFAAQTSAATVILTSSHFGFSLSTTHVASGAIMGSGVGAPGAHVRWGVAGRMALAWVITLPAAGLTAAGMYGIAAGIGGNAGIAVVGVIAGSASGAIWLASRRDRVHAGNVTDVGPPPPIAVVTTDAEEARDEGPAMAGAA